MFNELKNYGLSLENDLGPTDPRDYVVGTVTEIKKEVLREDRNYVPFLPPLEVQNKYGFDTMSCVTFSALNAVETIVKVKYNQDWNKSDRFNAVLSGTSIFGNTFANVAESLRKDGMVEESEWPWTKDINTWEKYMAPIPQELVLKGKENAKQISLKHEWVLWGGATKKEDALWEALKYGPLQVSVHTWGPIDSSGVYQPMPNTDNIPTNHAVLLVAGEYGKIWKIYDHYDKSIKIMAWNYYFGSAKQFIINLQSPMLQLVRGHERPHVYATDLNGEKHYIYNMAQLDRGAEIGLWEKSDKIKILAQEKVDAMPEGEPIVLGIK